MGSKAVKPRSEKLLIEGKERGRKNQEEMTLSFCVDLCGGGKDIGQVGEFLGSQGKDRNTASSLRPRGHTRRLSRC